MATIMQPNTGASGAPLRRYLREGIVVLAMSVIAASLGYVLFRQFDLGMGLSLLTALTVYVALICLHVSLRRGEQTDDLRAEIAELEHELEVLRHSRKAHAGQVAPPSLAPSPAFVRGAGPAKTGAPTRPVEPRKAQSAAKLSIGRGTAARAPQSQAKRPPSQVADAVDRGVYAGRVAVSKAADIAQPVPELKVEPRSDTLSQQAQAPQRAESNARPGTAGARLDVDRIEGLIRRLADDLSEGEAPDPVATGATSRPQPAQPARRPGPPAERAPTPSLPEASDGDLDPMISALRTVSERMRASAPNAPPRQAAAPVAKAHNPFVTAVADAIEGGRIDLYLQPIFGLNERRAKHFELSTRLRDQAGAPIPRSQYAGQLTGSGLLPQIDLAMLAAAGKIIRRLVAGGKSHNLFSNVASDSLADDAFLEGLAKELRLQDRLSGHLVVGFAQAAVQTFAPAHWDTLSTLAGLGFRFSLEAVTNLDMDLERLKENGFAFVKLDADVFLRGLPAVGAVIPSADLCRHIADLGFGLIVDGIRDEDSLKRLQRDGVLLGQGALLGGAKPVKAEILADLPQTHAA